MQALLDVILPVFLLVAFGYGASWKGWFSQDYVDGLMKFAQTFAIPCLLFSAIANLDLGQSFQWPILFSFYSGALTCFILGVLGARVLFKRDWEDAVAIGFIALFSNSVLLGLPITERAFGSESLAGNYAIIAIHSPFGLGLGIITMEMARAHGAPWHQVGGTIVKSTFSNPLIIGISLGFFVNLTGLPIPSVAQDALDLMIRAALPAALFGLGGVLYRYKPEGDALTIVYVVSLSLLLHPIIVWTLGSWVDLSQSDLRSALITAASAPGINAYLFANMYGRAKRVAASSVLIGTALNILSIWVWLLILS
ncbi:AEC family transporter [Nereida sp. MMG025]|uniref:AEC family transporter n=1 Tax=Nereida sp. MMG025 TaxID=2909981 RepID=UPI001F45076D|nr:AEC family transporter [Nereida sp. MMG025]MCF6443767.1 AEC family transporter [Nereida sp. MMG025]